MQDLWEPMCGKRKLTGTDHGYDATIVTFDSLYSSHANLLPYALSVPVRHVSVFPGIISLKAMTSAMSGTVFFTQE